MTDERRIPIPEAAARLNMDAKRLRGYVYRGTLGEFGQPIGCLETDEIYEFEVERLTKRR
jgi:hypothetical protein